MKKMHTQLIEWHRYQLKPTEVHAMAALQAIIKFGYAIPDELQPYIGKAVDTWQQTRGNKQRTKTMETSESFRVAIGWMAYFHKHCGMTRANAAREVCIVWDQYKPEYLIKQYNRAETRPHRALADQLPYLIVVLFRHNEKRHGPQTVRFGV